MGDKIRFGILTVSDRCSRGEYADESGDALADYIENESGGLVVERKCVPDEILDIKNTLLSWSRSDSFDVILTTGGTGFSPRDVTPEATKLVIDKEAPGMVIAMIKGSLEITPLAMLSRPACGIRNHTLIINLPGSKKGSMENLKLVIGPTKHAVHVLRDQKREVADQHTLLSASTLGSGRSKVDGTRVADRARKSKYTTEKVSLAQEMIIQSCNSTTVETVNLNSGLGYILAQDVIAKDPLPPFRASIKDGYALRTASTSDVLSLAGDSTAGENPDLYKLEDNYCVRISTGAPVPEEADAVIQVEDTELLERTADGKEEKKIRILRKPKIGQDIRAIGSDIQENELVLQKGTRIGPSELGILAAVGVAQFQVYRKPLVALLSTGNELQNPSEPIQKGKIRDSNKTTLHAVLQEAGFKTLDIGIARDTPDEVYQKLLEGLSRADVLVSTGGVSMGERDFLKEVLTKDFDAKIHFGSVLMKPGKPAAFATCTLNGVNKFIFSLPGNPVSATVTSHLFVIPACRKLSGSNNPFHSTIKVKVEKDFKLDITRPEYHRVRVFWTPDSPVPIAESTGNQISSRLLSCNSANGLLILPQGTEQQLQVKAGSVLDVLMTSSF